MTVEFHIISIRAYDIRRCLSLLGSAKILDAFNPPNDSLEIFTLIGMAAIVDSVAAFRERAIKYGIPQADILTLEANNAASFGQFAFIAVFNMNSTNDTALKEALTDLLGAEPSSLNMGRYRRLHFESHAIAISDAKLRLEKTDDMTPRKLPAPERAARYAAQTQRLSGIIWTPNIEPSHALLDRVQSQVEENLPAYISLDTCTSRFQELSGIKKESAASSKILELHASSGAMKAVAKETPLVASICDAHSLRLAFKRRALAYDQANLCSFEAMESWTEKLFASMMETPPPGYQQVSMAQIISADHYLFVKVIESCRAGVAPTGDPLYRPIEKAISSLSDDVTVTFHI